MHTLEKPTLAALLINATHEIDMGEGRHASIYYETESRARMRLPGGLIMSGEWRLLEDGYAVDWQNGPSATWKLAAGPGCIAYIDAEGKERGTVKAITYGANAAFSA